MGIRAARIECLLPDSHVAPSLMFLLLSLFTLCPLDVQCMRYWLQYVHHYTSTSYLLYVHGIVLVDRYYIYVAVLDDGVLRNSIVEPRSRLFRYLHTCVI